MLNHQFIKKYMKKIDYYLDKEWNQSSGYFLPSNLPSWIQGNSL